MAQNRQRRDRTANVAQRYIVPAQVRARLIVYDRSYLAISEHGPSPFHRAHLLYRAIGVDGTMTPQPGAASARWFRRGGLTALSSRRIVTRACRPMVAARPRVADFDDAIAWANDLSHATMSATIGTIFARFLAVLAGWPLWPAAIPRR